MIIKVCGMREPENIRAIEALDVQWMGFIFYPQSPRYVPDGIEYEEAIFNCKTQKVGVFVNEKIDVMLAKASKYDLSIFQLHGKESPYICNRVRLRGFFTIKAFSIASPADFKLTERYHDNCDCFLFDTKFDGYGGSGKRFDWNMLEAYQVEKPFILSGGLTLDCVEEIKQLKHPQFAGIDLNSGFEISPALKDPEKIKSFIQAFRPSPN